MRIQGSRRDAQLVNASVRPEFWGKHMCESWAQRCGRLRQEGPWGLLASRCSPVGKLQVQERPWLKKWGGEKLKKTATSASDLHTWSHMHWGGEMCIYVCIRVIFYFFIRKGENVFPLFICCHRSHLGKTQEVLVLKRPLGNKEEILDCFKCLLEQLWSFIQRRPAKCFCSGGKGGEK